MQLFAMLEPRHGRGTALAASAAAGIMMLFVTGCASGATERAPSESARPRVTTEALATADSLLRQASAARGEGRYADAERLYVAALTAGYPNPAGLWYAAASAAALAGDEALALDRLERAAAAGYRDIDYLAGDTTFARLRRDRGWSAIEGRVRENRERYRAAHGDPAAARLVMDDMVTFARAYERAVLAPDSAARVEVWRREYLERGSPGLIDFYLARKIESVEWLARGVAAVPRYYGWFAANPRYFAAMEPDIRAAFHRLEQLYPEAHFPDVYFVIGHRRSCGTVSSSGLLIGADCYGVTPSTPLDEFSAAARPYVHPAEELRDVVVHELMHFQQSYAGKKTLLEWTLVEGGAEFLTELVMPDVATPDNRAWALAHERDIWLRFREEMHGTDTSDWIANNDRETADWPAALSYFVGYRIAQAYYERATDKGQAIRDLMRLDDAAAILRASGYADRFGG